MRQRQVRHHDHVIQGPERDERAGEHAEHDERNDGQARLRHPDLRHALGDFARRIDVEAERCHGGRAERSLSGCSAARGPPPPSSGRRLRIPRAPLPAPKIWCERKGWRCCRCGFRQSRRGRSRREGGPPASEIELHAEAVMRDDVVIELTPRRGAVVVLENLLIPRRSGRGGPYSRPALMLMPPRQSFSSNDL